MMLFVSNFLKYSTWCRRALSLCFLLVLAGCTGIPSGPIDLRNSSYESPKLRADHPAWGSLAVRFVRDSRPGWELGFHNYLKESYYSDELFDLPVPVVLKRIILREAQAVGSFTPSQEKLNSKYLAELTLRHFYIRTDRNLLDLIPILPTTKITAVVDFDIKLIDQDGRLFLQKNYSSTDPDRMDRLSNLSGSGVDQLLTIMTTLIGELVIDMDQAVPAFWAELRLPVQ